jgi:hypothetical protein
MAAAANTRPLGARFRVVEERGNRDRGEDGDHEHDGEQLDRGEAALTASGVMPSQGDAAPLTSSRRWPSGEFRAAAEAI